MRLFSSKYVRLLVVEILTPCVENIFSVPISIISQPQFHFASELVLLSCCSAQMRTVHLLVYWDWTQRSISISVQVPQQSTSKSTMVPSPFSSPTRRKKSYHQVVNNLLSLGNRRICHGGKILLWMIKRKKDWCIRVSVEGDERHRHVRTRADLVDKKIQLMLQTTKRQLFYCWDCRLLNSCLAMLLRWSTLIAANFLSPVSKPKQQSTWLGTYPKTA